MKIHVLVESFPGIDEYYSGGGYALSAHRCPKKAEAARVAAEARARAAGENPGAYYGPRFEVKELDLEEEMENS